MYLVTGASSGIGHAITVALATEGAEVLAVARRHAPLDALHERFQGRVRPVVADLATDAGIDHVVANVSSLCGIVHAGGSRVPLEPYEGIDTERFAYDMAVHVTAPLALNGRLAQAIAGGRIVFIDSYSADAPRIGWAGYSIVKAAARMAARCAAAELNDVRVLRVLPGAMRTPMVEAILDADDDSPTVCVFRTLQAEGSINEAAVVATAIVDLFLHAKDVELDRVEVHDIGRSMGPRTNGPPADKPD